MEDEVRGWGGVGRRGGPPSASVSEGSRDGGHPLSTHTQEHIIGIGGARAVEAVEAVGGGGGGGDGGGGAVAVVVVTIVEVAAVIVVGVGVTVCWVVEG